MNFGPVTFPLILVSLVVGQISAATPSFTSGPNVAKNPNQRVPLAAIVSFEASEPVTTKLLVDDGESEMDSRVFARTKRKERASSRSG